MKKIPAPRADDVCDRIRGAWAHLKFVHDLQQIHVSHVGEAAIRETLENHARKTVAFQALEQEIVLVTPIEFEWIVTPRVPGSFEPDYAKSREFKPGDPIPAEWAETGSLHCRAYAFGLPAAALQGTGEKVR